MQTELRHIIFPTFREKVRVIFYIREFSETRRIHRQKGAFRMYAKTYINRIANQSRISPFNWTPRITRKLSAAPTAITESNLIVISLTHV